jgi:hypothetical protein
MVLCFGKGDDDGKGNDDGEGKSRKYDTTTAGANLARARARVALIRASMMRADKYSSGSWYCACARATTTVRANQPPSHSFSKNV